MLSVCYDRPPVQATIQPLHLHGHEGRSDSVLGHTNVLHGATEWALLDQLHRSVILSGATNEAKAADSSHWRLIEQRCLGNSVTPIPEGNRRCHTDG